MTIEAAITNLNAKLRALDGMKSVPEQLVETATMYPFGLVYERSGNLLLQSDSFAHDLATIIAEIHVSRQILPRTIEVALGFRTPFLKALIADPTLGGSVSTITAIRRTFGALQWGEIQAIGYRFEIDVKVQITV